MHGNGNRLAMNPHTPAAPRAARKPSLRAVALTTLAVLCALATPMLRAPVFAGAAIHAGPNPVTLGEKIFADPSLSASGAMSCATCHDPKHAHAQSNDLAVQCRRRRLRRTRAFAPSPSLRYLSSHARFLLRRRRHADRRLQPRRPRRRSCGCRRSARCPPPHEMANASAGRPGRTPRASALCRRVPPGVRRRHLRRRAGHAFGRDASRWRSTRNRPRLPAVRLQVRPFPRRQAAPDRAASCAASRSSTAPTRATAPAAIRAAAAPTARRRCSPISPTTTWACRATPTIPANADPAYFDLGLCGPIRTDLADRTDLCGAFKVPTLRNVAHAQGVLPQRPLQDAARRAALLRAARHAIPRSGTRSTPTAASSKFDDLPAELRTATSTPPRCPTTASPARRRADRSGDRRPRSVPDTLTDGYTCRGRRPTRCDTRCSFRALPH